METRLVSTEDIEVLLCQKVTKERKVESEEDHGTEYIQ